MGTAKMSTAKKILLIDDDARNDDARLEVEVAEVLIALLVDARLLAQDEEAARADDDRQDSRGAVSDHGLRGVGVRALRGQHVFLLDRAAARRAARRRGGRWMGGELARGPLRVLRRSEPDSGDPRKHRRRSGPRR